MPHAAIKNLKQTYNKSSSNYGSLILHKIKLRNNSGNLINRETKYLQSFIKFK